MGKGDPDGIYTGVRGGHTAAMYRSDVLENLKDTLALENMVRRITAHGGPIPNGSHGHPPGSPAHRDGDMAEWSAARPDRTGKAARDIGPLLGSDGEPEGGLDMEYVPDQVTLWNQTREGMAIVAEEGTILRANPALCEFLGYSETELLDMTFMDVTASTDLRADLAEYDKLIRREIDSYTMSKLYRTKSGRLRPGKLRAYRLPGADKILILGQVLPTDPFEAAGVPSDHQAEVMTMAVSQLLVAGAKNWKVVLAIVAILTGLKLDTLIELLSK